MNYIKQPEAIYPYTFAMLCADYPGTSFPRTPNATVFAEYGAYAVTDVAPPEFDPTLQVVEEGSPALVDNVWTQQWIVRDLTDAELQVRVPRSVSKLQGMLAIAKVGLAAQFLAWKASLDPVADFEALAFLDVAQTWEYDHPLLNAALVALGCEEQKDVLFTLAATL